MALVLKDRVKQTAAAPGTGTITLGATAAGFQSFASVGNGNTTYYAIVDPLSGDWEVNYGVYTSSGTTLTRNATPLSSSTGTLVNFTGTVDVFLTYPSEKAVWQDLSGVVAQQSFGAITATSAALTSGTITTAPVNATDIVNKEYADSIASGLNYHQPVNYGSTAALPAYTYNNGSSGVGATITANANGALSLGGGSPTATQRVLIKDEVSGNAPYNGVYVVTQAGSAGTPFILTRATDYDTSGTGTNEIDQGDYVLVISGTLASTAWVQQTPLPITVGTTALTFLQFNAPITYTAGTGLNLSPATTFNISNTGVSASTYGSASVVPVFAVNAQGQITSVTNTNIAISGSAVSGNISGSAGSVANALTLGTYLTGGTYNGSAAVTATVDATSANTASKVVARDSSGNFSAGTITATLIGSATSATTATNLAGGAANQIAYQSASGTTSFATAPSASNQVLSWNGSAFSWSAGTISGVPLGSNLNSLTAGTYLTGTAYNGSAAQTWAVDATSANTASKVVARDASGNFSAGTITASLSGNATSATNSTTTSQTNFSNLTIGGSQVLYAGNYNSYAPTLTGTGASGTWGISISGNAATATSATTATTSTYTTYISNISLGTGSVNVNYGSSAVLRNENGSGAALAYSPVLHVAAGDTMWQAQGSYGSSGDGTLYFRQGYNGSWGNWLTMLSSYNYNSYAPTLTGTGASGTWNISITGSAGSAPGYLPLSGGTMTGTITGGSGVSSLVTGNYAGALRGYLYNDSSGFGFLTYAGNWGVRVDYGTNSVYIPGIGYSDASLRAPIFYDTNDTGYYVDPASTSNLNVVNLLSGKWYPVNNGSGNSAEIYVRPDNNNTYVWRHIYGGTSTGFGTGVGGYGIYAQHLGGNYSLLFSADGYVTAPYSFRAPIFYDSDNTSYFLNPYSPGGSALVTRGEVRFENNSGTTTHFNYANGSTQNYIRGTTYFDNGPTYITSNLYANIFYDSDNTSYYADPSGTSQFNEFYANNIYANAGQKVWARYAGGTTYAASLYWNALQLGNNGNNYIFAGQNATGGLLDIYVNATSYSPTVSGTLATRFDSNGYVYNFVATASPIFYDYNNSAYYVDPAGTSQLSTVTMDGWLYKNGTAGIYWNSYGYGIQAAGVVGSYGNIATYGTGQGGWNGYNLGGQWTLMNSGNGDNIGIHSNSTSWLWYWDGGVTNFYRGYTQFANSIRAPIFYDSDNTSYYLDPTGTSNVSMTCYGGWYFRSDYNTASGSSPPLQAYSSGGNGAVMAFHRGGYYAVNMGLDSDNVFRLGGWSASANLLQITMSGNLTMLANITAYSDERLKKDWDDLPSDFVPRLARVKSGTYTRIDNEMRQIGVGAQSLRPLMEEAVFENEDGTLSVAYGNAAMASSVELAKYVTALEQRISQLEARI